MKTTVQLITRILIWLSIIVFLFRFAAMESIATTAANCLFTIIVTRILMAGRTPRIEQAETAS
ncbi:hypothetical protein [Nocardia jiangxiensis]|uniref:hypothetical protein n=1 Tax=Nocardia jiangxiensis TaxID=282685 RepID=UPI0012F6446F|nr:hypothetical protein [Nocardia jiangxiensis]